MDDINGIQSSTGNPANPVGASPVQPGMEGMAAQQPTLNDQAPNLEAAVPPAVPQNLTGQEPATSSKGKEASTGSGKGKIILVSLVVVLLIVGAAGGGWFIGKNSGYSAGFAAGEKEAAAEFQKAAAGPSDPDDLEEVQLELGELKEPEYKNESIEEAVGQQVTANDGLVLMVTNVERNFKTEDASYKLDDSKELVKVNFLLGNITKDRPKDISSFNFRLINSRGAQLTPENIADYEGKFDTIKIDPGTQVKASVIYAVDKNDKPLTFTRSQVYRITNQNTEVTTKISIKVAE